MDSRLIAMAPAVFPGPHPPEEFPWETLCTFDPAWGLSLLRQAAWLDGSPNLITRQQFVDAQTCSGHEREWGMSIYDNEIGEPVFGNVEELVRTNHEHRPAGGFPTGPGLMGYVHTHPVVFPVPLLAGREEGVFQPGFSISDFHAASRHDWALSVQVCGNAVWALVKLAPRPDPLSDYDSPNSPDPSMELEADALNALVDEGLVALKNLDHFRPDVWASIREKLQNTLILSTIRSAQQYGYAVYFANWGQPFCRVWPPL